MDVKNKIALVTGASSGIGLEVAALLARRGARVILVSNVPDELKEAAKAIGDSATALEADLLKKDQVENLVERAEGLAGPLDILVNNAGIGLHKSLLESTDDEFRRLFQVNFFAAVTLSRAALESMRSRGRGAIVNVSSASARRALSEMTAYAASKGAMHSFGQALRLEAQRDGVAVSEVLPISVATPFFSAAGYQPKGLVQTPEWVARCVLKAIETGQAEVHTSQLAAWALALDGLFPNLVARVLAWRSP